MSIIPKDGGIGHCSKFNGIEAKKQGLFKLMKKTYICALSPKYLRFPLDLSIYIFSKPNIFIVLYPWISLHDIGYKTFNLTLSLNLPISICLSISMHFEALSQKSLDICILHYMQHKH